MFVKAGLCIDFGNSETRAVLITGGKNYSFNLSNKFALLEEKYNVTAKYQNLKSTIFGYNGMFYANGEIVDREFTRDAFTPDSNRSKTEQIATELTLRLVLINAFALMAKMYTVAINDLDVTFDIFALLPPLDHEKNEAQFETLIRSVTEVICISPNHFTLPFKIGDVSIQSEGVAAFLGALYEETGEVVSNINTGKSLENGDVLITEYISSNELIEIEENARFTNGYVLVLDIGAGTTDVALIKDTELIEGSKDSFNVGGNRVNTIVGRFLRMQYGYIIPPDVILKAVLTGLFIEGNSEHIVDNIVTSAKKEYGSEVQSLIQSYLTNMKVGLRQVKGVLVVGGGAVPSIRNEEVVSPSMGEVLLDYLKVISPDILLVSTGNKSHRNLNITGLTYMYKYSD